MTFKKMMSILSRNNMKHLKSYKLFENVNLPKNINSMLGGRMNLSASDFEELYPSDMTLSKEQEDMIKDAFETAYLRGNYESRNSLKTLLNKKPYSDLKSLVDEIDSARGTANTDTRRQFSPSNQEYVTRRGTKLF
jgi:hypothetical protein